MRMDSERRSHAPPVIPHPHLVELLHRRALRRRIEAAVGRLIEALDALDDPEAEPSLGAPIAADHHQTGWSCGADDDREAEADA